MSPLFSLVAHCSRHPVRSLLLLLGLSVVPTAAHGQESKQILYGHTDGVKSVAVSSPANLIASASVDRTIKLWALENGQLLRTIEAHTDLISFVTFSPDGKTLASASYDQTVKLWDV